MGDEQDEMNISIETGSNPNEIIVYFQKQNDSYTLDFEKNESNTLFQIPIEFPETVINTTTREIKNEPLTLTMLEKNDINFNILNNCLSYSNTLGSYDVEATVYIHIPNLFTVRFQISNSKELDFIAYVSYIVSNNEGRWQIDTLNLNEKRFTTVTNNGADQIQNPHELLIIQSRDDDSLYPVDESIGRLSKRHRPSHVNFTFDSVYETMLKKHINSIEKALKNPGSPEPQSKKGSQTEPQSAFSPLKQAMGKMKNLSIENILFNISNHTVEGLQKIANDRFDNNSVIPVTLMNLDGDENNKPTSLKKQLESPSQVKAAGGALYKQKNCWRMINDTVDRAHDFIKVYDSTLKYNKEQLPECGRFFGSLNGLAPFNGNINVPNSHSIQETNIVGLHANLNENNFIIPALPKDVFVSRRFIYADFVEFLFKVSIDSNLITSRNHYAESGKQVTIDTLLSYLRDLKKDSNEEGLFLRDVSLLTNNELSTIDEIIQLIDRMKKDKNMDGDYPTIPKNCYQRMDGCTTGPKADSELTPGNATIEGIFGLFDIELNKVECNKDKKDTPIKNTLTVTTSDKTILYQTEIDGEITLDKVVASIQEVAPVGQKDYPFRGAVQDEGYKGSFKGEANNPQLRVLIFMALKTFCDKLYRLSMPSSEKVTLTHIYTIDSYVYGDPYLQYLLGEVEYCPAVLRSASGIVNEDVLDENGNVTKNLICENGGKTKGFWFRPSMGIGQSGKGFLEKLYHRYMSYYFMLNNALKQPGIGLYTTQFFKVNTTLNKPAIQSHRLNNFIERILYFYGTYKRLKNNPIDNISSDNISSSKLSYDDIMGHLAYLEICKVLKDIRHYLGRTTAFINFIISSEFDQTSLKEIEEVQKFLISVPDLENTLQLSIPNLYIENQDIDVNVGESSSADKRSRDMLLHTAEIELCQKFEIQGFSEPSSGQDSAELAPTYTYVSYNDINDVITYTKGTRPISKPFTLELFIDLYNVQDDTKLKENMKQIIKDKIETIKDLIGIKNFECDLTLSDPLGTVEEEGTGSDDEGAGSYQENPKPNYDQGSKESEGKALFGNNKRTASERSPDSKKGQSTSKRPSVNSGSGELSFPAGVGMSGDTSEEPAAHRSPDRSTDSGPGQLQRRGTSNAEMYRDDIPYSDDDPEVISATYNPMNPGTGTGGIFGTGYKDQPGGTKLKRKQTHRVKKKLRKTINKISKMSYKNKTKRRLKKLRKTRKS